MYKVAFQLAKKEQSIQPSSHTKAEHNATKISPPTREQLLDEEIFLGQLHRSASVLNSGFQAAVLERICDHLYTSLPGSLQQGGPAQAEDFFRDSDLFLTECIYVDPSVHSAQPERVTATASLCWQEVARPQAENAATPMAGGLPTFTRARSAGQDVRPGLAGPAPWQELAPDGGKQAGGATMMMMAAEALGEARAGSGLGFTRSRSAAGGEAAVACGTHANTGWDVVGVFTRSRYHRT